MNLIEKHLPLLSILISSSFALANITLAIMRERRERRKERNERLQIEYIKKENGVYPPRKDKHHKR
ncbi:hypothetical protein [Paenibacillus sp. FSL H3-0286]|uniref:hypothetical protein n=1 Tax=Paenibacillus sp. FSL H3-0286 TaxID=2921427 RepID=UPI0032546B1A